MHAESIRAAPSDFEARRLLLQSGARPGTSRLFAEVIGRMDRVKCFASRHGESVVGRTRGEGDRYIGVAESPRRPLPGILTLELIHHKRVMMASHPS